MVRNRRGENLDGWLETAKGSGIPEMQGFATKLRQDQEAVSKGLMLEWSQGQVEGQVTKLKLIRRQMYGRGNFDLVRKRVLHKAARLPGAVPSATPIPVPPQSTREAAPAHDAESAHRAGPTSHTAL